MSQWALLLHTLSGFTVFAGMAPASAGWHQAQDLAGQGSGPPTSSAICWGIAARRC